MEVQGAPDFLFAATMNPGGDFGKRELSPALRNRFTEVGALSWERCTPSWSCSCAEFGENKNLPRDQLQCPLEPPP